MLLSFFFFVCVQFILLTVSETRRGGSKGTYDYRFAVNDIAKIIPIKTTKKQKKKKNVSRSHNVNKVSYAVRF